LAYHVPEEVVGLAVDRSVVGPHGGFAGAVVAASQCVAVGSKASPGTVLPGRRGPGSLLDEGPQFAADREPVEVGRVGPEPPSASRRESRTSSRAAVNAHRGSMSKTFLGLHLGG